VMPVQVIDVSEAERDKILALHESHFCDVKSTLIKPAKLTRTIAALSNAEGGEVYVGVEEDKPNRVTTWSGFRVPEDANGHLQAFEALFPLGEGYGYGFLRSQGARGLVLKIDVGKSRDVKTASDNNVYIRRGAQNLPVDSQESLTRLRRNKGLIFLKRSP
jgi:ATP-dependent DNA helicase RecG